MNNFIPCKGLLLLNLYLCYLLHNTSCFTCSCPRWLSNFAMPIFTNVRIVKFVKYLPFKVQQQTFCFTYLSTYLIFVSVCCYEEVILIETNFTIMTFFNRHYGQRNYGITRSVYKLFRRGSQTQAFYLTLVSPMCDIPVA